jgi:tetratricopeptide (TPR) repeat protein
LVFDRQGLRALGRKELPITPGGFRLLQVAFLDLLQHFRPLRSRVLNAIRSVSIPPSTHDEIGHFYLAQTGRSHFAATGIRDCRMLRGGIIATIQPVGRMSMARLGLSLLAAIACLFAGADVRAQSSDRGVISGTVYYAGSHKPVENITVELQSPEGGLISPQSTTGTGFFEFRNLSRGIYVVSIRVQGYEPVSESVDLSFTSDRGMEIYLTPRRDNAPGPKPGPTVSSHELTMSPKARELVESGKRKLYQDKDVHGALEDFQQAVQIAPDYYEAYNQMGMASLSINERQDAEKSFRKSIELSGDKYGDADVNLGAMLLDKGDNPGGEKLLRHGVQLNPNSFLGYYELGRAQLNQQRIPEALKSAQQARSLAPNVPLVYRLLSNVHLKEKDYPALLSDLDAYIKLDPDSPAGIRARQLREEVQKKLAKDAGAVPAAAKP